MNNFIQKPNARLLRFNTIKKYLKGIFLIVLIKVFTITNSYCQQDAIYVTYPNNPMAINPAYAGSNGIANITILVRKQSLVLQNVGSSQFLSYNTPLSNGKFGLGFQAYNSNFGQTINNNGSGLNMSGAFRHHFSDSISVSIGAQFGFAQVPSLYAAPQYKPLAGFGAYFRSFNTYFGIAMPVYTKTAYNYPVNDKNYYPRYLFISGGHVLKINETYNLKLGAVIKQTINNTSKMDLNIVLWYKKALGLGIWKNNSGSEVNPQKALIISLEGQINPKFRIGISMDAASKSAGTRINPTTGRTSNLSLYNLMLRYDFDNLTGKINNFRFF